MGILQNQVALVTGAGRGIGRAIALALAAEGAKVAITARTTAELDEVSRQIQTAGGKSLCISADLADRGAPAKVAADVKKTLGPIDILVNNAGVGSSAEIGRA